MTYSSESTAAPLSSVPVQHSWGRRLLRTLRLPFARLASRDGYVEARAAPFGLTFAGPAADCITRHIYRIGAHEPVITRHLIDTVRLQSGDIAFDIGANIGWYSVLLDRLSTGNAQIFAFEPDPESYELLKRNLSTNRASRVTPLNVALGDKPGTAELRRYSKRSNNGRHTLLAGNEGGEVVQVPVQTLAGFWEANGLGERPIRFMKIDVEGYEYFVLRGANELLSRCERVLLEFSPDGLRLAGLKREDFIDLLAQARLTAQAFVNDQLVPMSFAELARAETQHDLLLQPG